MKTFQELYEDAQIVSRERARKAAYLMRLRQEKKESFLSIHHVVRGVPPA